MTSPKVWFITGSSSGFGRAMTETVLRRGGIAVATLRKPTALSDLAAEYPPDRLLLVQLDVTKPDQVTAAFAQAKRAFGRIDVVFNNAGAALFAETEGTPEEAARALFEVNFWGAANVSREAVRFFRDENKPAGGIILQNTSMACFGNIPLIGYYTATKLALEGLSTSIAAEIEPSWNIKITLIEPGAFQSNVADVAVRSEPHPAYASPTSRVSLFRPNLTEKALTGDTEKATEVIYKVAGLSEPPLHFPLGRDSVAHAKQLLTTFQTAVEQYGPWSDEL
ncbi:NAD(P)-binding protein [Wolfiporia cocos MD-104 SS10]|uniref:NAD(P)-binding protein n=1 Tax=Wolfiporia cocos (strain MD-104) TaxID=742152 RepID=A0A2H3JQN6_WOLCO|nr:NAD(P)-binding protein [Wolfiporia cocos MD-104 SS10]